MSAALRSACAAFVLVFVPSLFVVSARRADRPLPAAIALPAELALRYRSVGFGELAEASLDGDDAATRAIPPALRALDGAQIALRGYAIPTAYEGAGVTELLIVPRNDLGCCFGYGMRPTEWVAVRWRGAPIEAPPQSTPVTVLGRLHVAPVFQDGTLAQLYEMDGEAIQP